MDESEHGHEDHSGDMVTTFCSPCATRGGWSRAEYPMEYALAAQRASEGAAVAYMCPFDSGFWHLWRPTSFPDYASERTSGP